MSTRLISFLLLLVLSGCVRNVARTQRAHAPVTPNSAPVAAPVVEEDDEEYEEDEGEEEREGQGTPGADWFLSRRVAPGETALDPAVQQRAMEQLRAMPTASVNGIRRLEARAQAGTEGWAQLGPGVVSGRTRSLVVNPRDPNILYAGAVTGGVWKTTDGGQRWRVLTDGLSNLTVGALALDPADPNVIYAGGGELYSSVAGEGIRRSTDAGATWTLLPATARQADFSYINRIVISPLSSQRIYAATGRGIMASRDGGATWTRVLTALYYGCQDLAMRTDTPTDYLFAVCSGATSTETFSVYRNTDAAGAGTWSAVYTKANMGRSVLAIAPSRQSTVYVAAAGLGSPANARDGVGLAGVFRSTANGDADSWTTQASGTDANPFNYLLFSAANSGTTGYCGGGAAPANDGGTWGKMIAVDPLDPDRVWVGGVDLFRSDDGGLSWGVSSVWNVQGSQFSHADRHAIVFHPGYNGAANQTAWQLTDTGVFVTTNARAAVSTGTRAGCRTEFLANAKVNWANLNTDFSVTQFYTGTVYPGGQYYFGGSQDSGVNRGFDGGLNSWNTLGGGDGAGVVVDPVDPNRLLFSSQQLGLRRSLNGGASSTAAVSGITETASTFPFIAALAADPNDANNVYLGGRTNLWRSADFAATWTASAATGTSGAVSAIAVSPADSNNVLFGTNSGFVFRSANALQGAGTWSSVRPRSGNISSIAFDPVTPDVVYAVYSSLRGTAAVAHVYRSTDNGVTWTARDGTGTGQIPDIPAWSIRVNPRNPQMLYLGTDLGLLISTDAGATWGRDDLLPAVITEEVAFDPGANYLFAFTHGRGLFRTPLAGGTSNCTYSVSPTTLAAGPEGGVLPVNVTAPSGCGWAAAPGANPARFALQSPGLGTGNGAAYIAVPANFDGTAATDSVSVAAQAVAVSQTAATFAPVGNDLRAGAGRLAIPGAARSTARNFTSSADDPVHSCTGSADFATAWWQVTPSVSGVLSLQVRADRLDVFGNSGAVVTAYARTAPSAELTCAKLARDNTGRTIFSGTLAVTAGETYDIEISALTADGNNANYGLITGMTTADAAVTVTPATLTVAPGSGPVQLTATVSGPANQAVRWSISPALGRISPDGWYTPPVSGGAGTEVTVTARSFADPAKSATARIALGAGAPIAATAAGLLSAASYVGGGVTPGQIAVLFGSGFGPATLAGLTVTPEGFFSTTAGGTSVTFDGVAAPMIYAVNGQLSAIVPYSVAGKATTQMQVRYNGQTSAPVTVPVVAAAPSLFTANASGKGQAAALNQNLSVNSAANPAARGSVIVLYGTGEGQTDPPGVDGRINNAVFPKPVLPVRVTIGGIEANIGYFGAAPGLVSGLFQANVTIPAGVPAGDVPVVVTVGGVSSPSGLTIAVR